MLLEQVMHFNDLSPKLREELTTKIQGFGKVVRYKFNISKPNPDPTRYNGDTVWPHLYSLSPTVFNIIDPHEDRKEKQKSKRIGLIDAVDEQGRPNRFRKIKVWGSAKGILTLHPNDNTDDFYYAMYLEIHPRLSGGKFMDKAQAAVITCIDEAATAKEERRLRSARKLAMDTAEKMSDAEVEEFADAMSWIKEDVEVLRNKVEALAESEPSMFNDLVADKRLKYQASIKRGIDTEIFKYDPVDGKLTWANTGMVVCMLGNNTTDKNEIQRLAEWFISGGTNADNAYKKLTKLLKGEQVEKV